MNKNANVILSARVPAEVADRAAAIGLGNKSKGIVDAVMSFKGLDIPPPPPPPPPPAALELIKGLANRLNTDTVYFETLMSQAVQGMKQASERLAGSVAEAEQAIAEAAGPRAKPANTEYDEDLPDMQETETYEDYLIRVAMTLKQVEAKSAAWEAAGEGRPKSVTNPHQTKVSVWNQAWADAVMFIADMRPRLKADGTPMTPEERLAFTRARLVEDIHHTLRKDSAPAPANALTEADRTLLAQAKLAEGVDIHGNMVELASRVRRWEAQAAASLGVAQRLVSWFEEHRLCLEKGVTFEDLKERVEYANTEIEAQLEANSSLASLPHIDTDKGLVFTDAQLAEALRLA